MKKDKSSKPVSADMNIAEITKKFPQAAEVLVEYGLHCVGCAINEYESIEQGAMGHGMDKEMIDDMIAEMNLVITKKPDFPLNEKGITITPRAVKMLKSLMKEDKDRAKGLQLKAQKGEGGLDYFLDLVKGPEEGEDTLDWKGIQVFIDEHSLRLMKPSIVDFVKSPGGEGFKIISLS